MDDFSAFEDSYYSVEVSCLRRPGGTWSISATVRRRDADEIVGSVDFFAANQEQGLLRLKAELVAYMPSFPRPPHQWGQVEIRKLLMQYRSFNNGLTLILVKLQQKREAGTLSESELHDAFWDARIKACAGSVALVRSLEKLSENDRIDLMKASEEAYEHPENPWYLDDLDGRDKLFDFILEPSEAVIKAYNIHRSR